MGIRKKRGFLSDHSGRRDGILSSERGLSGLRRDSRSKCPGAMSEAPYEILLFYRYAVVPDAESFHRWQVELCQELGLRGRLLVAGEGINGTLSGTREATASYRAALDADERTRGIEWKIDPAEGHVFPRLSVKLREEIVTLGLGDENFSPMELTGGYLEPAAWKEAMEEENVVLIDTRNDYEWEMGRFRGALLPEVESFKELPAWVRKNREKLEGKKILTYCTGGIRCEKFSGFLKQEGFEDVFQLHGGIVSYGKDEEAKGEGFEGECYVFDRRVGVPVNRAGDSELILRCVSCGTPGRRYRNCAWSACNTKLVLCETCEAEKGRYCGSSCRNGEAVGWAAHVVSDW